ncbi:M48 family metallopeptidase [Haladaptatus sp. DYSN1]|uniref:M48 family metallopeptidase n=1 Tax=unclassified Haladaptatus TaxID=2622732 RepID=UPI002406445B|nr:M48 family metalloprotease [Haladaptatus sp. DYSN1]
MRHFGLKVRMAVAGAILFAFYMVIATIAWSMTGSIALVAVLSLLLVAGQYKLGKWLAVRSVGAEDLPEDRFADIHRTTERLSEDMGIPKPRLMYAQMGSPNAFAVGRKGSGTVVISTELMQLLDDDELEGVIAHELAHIMNRDVVTMVLGQSVAMLIGWGVYFMVRQVADGIFGWILAWIASVIANMLVMIFVLVISRVREYAADEDAAYYTGNPEALASALAKLGHVNQQVEETNIDDSVSAMCIFGVQKGLFASLFATHPPIEKRINRLRQRN